MTRTAADFLVAVGSPKPEANGISQSPPPPPMLEKRSTLLSSFSFHIPLSFFTPHNNLLLYALHILHHSPACQFSEYTDSLTSLCFPQTMRCHLTPGMQVCVRNLLHGSGSLPTPPPSARPIRDPNRIRSSSIHNSNTPRNSNSSITHSMSIPNRRTTSNSFATTSNLTTSSSITTMFRLRVPCMFPLVGTHPFFQTSYPASSPYQ